MINAIDVSLIDDTTYLNELNDKLRILKNVKRINIFIGENNSGKSRMLRTLLKKENMPIFSESFIDDNKVKSLNNYFGYIDSNVKEFNQYNDIKMELPDVSDLNDIEKYITISNYIYSLNITSETVKYNAKSSYNNIMQHLGNIKSLLTKQLTSGNPYQWFNKLNLTYIPILRGIECFDKCYELKREDALKTLSMNDEQRTAMDEYKENSKSIYKNKIAKAYNIKNKDLIFTAENLYDEITSKLLGREDGRLFIRDFQEFISKEFYNGEEFTIIPSQKDEHLIVKIGEEERALHDLGDGIKQLISILYKIYEKRNETAVFLIEEPEINLHPGYQRKLINILQLEMFNKHQYFITTHSNHLIDSCFDYDNISIYKFININKRNNTFQIINTSPNDVEMLQLLGVNNSSVFMSNCTIWVEGISDKILISKYLSVYLKNKKITKYKEDIHYSFVEYGGNNVAHWAFIPNDDIETINSSGITNRSFIICDNDNNSISKAKRKEKLKAIFGKKYYELKSREIENTVNRNVLEKMLFGDLAKVKTIIPYTGNAYADEETRMGTFIDEHYSLKKKYGKTETGTISCKLDFAKKISENINGIEDLSPQALKICDKIYKFIEESNPE